MITQATKNRIPAPFYDYYCLFLCIIVDIICGIAIYQLI